MATGTSAVCKTFGLTPGHSWYITTKRMLKVSEIEISKFRSSYLSWSVHAVGWLSSLMYSNLCAMYMFFTVHTTQSLNSHLSLAVWDPSWIYSLSPIFHDEGIWKVESKPRREMKSGNIFKNQQTRPNFSIKNQACQIFCSTTMLESKIKDWGHTSGFT